ncbi:hypothetical protein MKEN_00620900 [Mycena kentingensis (nom. inval.)]|nr:hypothetical protein MKEN_00620900 [Mycena kentingensis (nom. inval.)]
MSPADLEPRSELGPSRCGVNTAVLMTPLASDNHHLRLDIIQFSLLWLSIVVPQSDTLKLKVSALVQVFLILADQHFQSLVVEVRDNSKLRNLRLEDRAVHLCNDPDSILVFSDFSTIVFRTKTRSPGSKLRSRMVCSFVSAYRFAAARFSADTRSRMSATWPACFASAWARYPINSAVVSTRSGSSTSHVASTMSSGSLGCAPVAMKYGEQPNPRRMVMRSAQRTCGKNQNHLFGFPPVAFTSICRSGRCPDSIFPLAFELYGDTRMP